MKLGTTVEATDDDQVIAIVDVVQKNEKNNAPVTAPITSSIMGHPYARSAKKVKRKASKILKWMLAQSKLAMRMWPCSAGVAG